MRSQGEVHKKFQDQKFLSAKDAEKQTGLTTVQVSRWRKHLADPDKYADSMILAANRKAGLEPAENHRAIGSGENEWYTPARYIDLVRRVMGGIDLGPATSLAAQRIVRAAAYFTKADNGLTREWRGRVWLNPPYTQPAIQLFAEKMVAEYRAGR